MERLAGMQEQGGGSTAERGEWEGKGPALAQGWLTRFLPLLCPPRTPTPVPNSCPPPPLTLPFS